MAGARKSHGKFNADVQAENLRWVFRPDEVKKSPSYRDGVSSKSENVIRRRHALFMQDVGTVLMLPATSIHVAIKLWQRFFMVESLKSYEPFEISFACIFISGKITEHFRALRDVVYHCRKVLTKHSKEFPEGEEVYWNHPGFEQKKRKILENEFLVLRTLNFDINVSSGQMYLPALMSFLYHKSASSQARLNETHAIAQFIMNDSMQTNLHLLYREEEIASACSYLAFVYHNTCHKNGEDKDAKRAPSSLDIPDFESVYQLDSSSVLSIVDDLLDYYEKCARKRKR